MKNDSSVAQPSVVNRQAPARAPSVASDATVPFSQAAISGVLIATCATILLGLFVQLGGGWNWNLLGVLAGIWAGVAIGATTILWFVQLSAAQRTIWTIEHLAGIDLNGDKQAGEPVRWIPVNSAGGVAPSSAADTVAARFEGFIEMAYSLGKTDIRTARQHGYSDADWKLFMDALEAAGMAVTTRKGENAPRRLVAPSAKACIQTMRKRGMFMGESVSSSSSSP